MRPILFKIGVFSIHAYGFMIAIAFLVGILVSMYYAKREGLKSEVVLDVTIYIILAGIAGARLLYVIGQWGYYSKNFLEIFMVQRGGLAFLGGFLMVLSVILLFAHMRRIPALKLFDVLAPGVALGYAFARIGCFLNGCCFGTPTNSFLGMIFPFGSLAHVHYPGETIHPTQLYALFAMLAVFLILVFMWKSKKFDGQIFFWWLILYSAYRFIVEFFRYCPADLYFLRLNPGQWIVIALAIFAVYGLMHKGFKARL